MGLRTAKKQINDMLDEQAGRPLGVEERRRWWLVDERYLDLLEPDKRDALLDLAAQTGPETHL